MISLENIKYSLENLVKRKSRSFLTILSIFVGISTIFIFISFGWGLWDYVNEIAAEGSADKFTVEGKGIGAPGTSPITLGDDEADAIKRTKGVHDIEVAYFKAVEVEQDGIKKYVYLIGLDYEESLMMELSSIGISRGRQVSLGDSGKIAVGYNYQIEDKLFPKALDLNDKLIVNGEKYKIVGFYDPVGNPADDVNVYMDIETYEKTFPDEGYSMIVGRADIDRMDEVVERVRKNVRDVRGEEEGQEEFNVASFQEQIEAFGAALNIIVAFIIVIAFISVIVSAVNTTNTMVTSVVERIKEIGVIKSIGAKNSEIFNIFFFESSFLGFIAGVVGVLVGWFLAESMAGALNTLGYGFLSPHISPSIFIGGIAFATIVGAIAGVVPAIQAAKLKPVDALRYE